MMFKKVWPEGVDMVLDMVGGDYLNRNFKILKQDGKVVYLAMLAGRYADNLDMAMLLGKKGRPLLARHLEIEATIIKLI